MLQLTIEDLRNLLSSVPGQSGKSHSLKIGEAYLIRAVTTIYTGRVVDVTDSDVVLADAAWIADTGRFYNCLKDGTCVEVEPYPDGAIVARGSILDVAPWPHPLPREQK